MPRRSWLSALSRVARLSMAEERAKSLLLQHLTPEQKATFEEHGYFDFRGSQGGKYRLFTSETLLKAGVSTSYNLAHRPTIPGGTRVRLRNIFVTENGYSAAANLPEADTLLALKVAIEANERHVEIGCSMDALAEPLFKEEYARPT